MRQRFALVLVALLAACASYAEPPPHYELTWAKRGVAFEAFVADVDACNQRAEAAGRAVETLRGDPQNDLQPLIMVWRALSHSAATDTAMAAAYDGCFKPRDYALSYVTETDAQAFRDIAFEPLNQGEPPDQLWRRKREEQLRALYRLATVEHPLRANIETRFQRRPLLSYVAAP